MAVNADKVFHTSILAALSMVFFAANSILCRKALGQELIPPLEFTTIRLMSGAIILAFIICGRSYFTEKNSLKSDIQFLFSRKDWLSALTLFVYMIGFSYAYVQLDAAVGALILFASVQFSMIFLSLVKGHKIKKNGGLSIGITTFGFIYLLAPGLSAPPILFSTIMSISGISWGIYSSQGNNHLDSLAKTAASFIRITPFCFVATMVFYEAVNVSSDGILLAISSGAIASGLGYVIWNMALRDLSSIQASIIQLTVPVITGLGGILFLGESLNIQFVIASALILGGVAYSKLSSN